MTKNPTQYDEKLDRASILERLDGNEELMVELVQLFQEEAPQLIEAMRDALRQADMPVLGRTAHSMKGAAGNFSSHGAASAASQLEIDAKKGDVAAAKVSFANLEEAVERLLPELVDLCQGSTK